MKMRIGINEVLIYDRSSGARQRELSILPRVLQHLAGQGHEAVVYVSDSIDDRLLSRLIGDNACEIVRTPLPSIPTWKRIMNGINYWEKQVSNDRVTLFHTPYCPIPALPIPTILTIHDLRFKLFPSSYQFMRRFFLQLSVPVSIRRASRIITVSQDTKNDIVKYFNKQANSVDVIHNVADHTFNLVVDKTQLRRVRQTYLLPQHYILFVGHLEPRKNIKRLIEAYITLLSNKSFHHHLVILGKPSFGYEDLLKAVCEKGLYDRVVFTDYVQEEDMNAIYTLADLFVLPSLHEGFGVPILEAMACEVPVITSNVSAMPEAAGGAALLVDPYDSQNIADSIFRVLNDNDLSEELVRKGKERISELTSAKAAREVFNSYQEAHKRL